MERLYLNCPYLAIKLFQIETCTYCEYRNPEKEFKISDKKEIECCIYPKKYASDTNREKSAKC